MHIFRWRHAPRLALGALAATVLMSAAVASSGAAVAAPGDTTSGTLYFTQYGNQGNTCTNTGSSVCPYNVFKVSYTYDPSASGQRLVLGQLTNVANLPGADGIILTPNNTLLVGGQYSGKIYEITTSGTSVGSASTKISEVDEITLNGSTIYAGGNETSSSAGSTLDTVTYPGLTQSNTSTLPGGVTQLAFAPGLPGQAMYTSSGYNGNGSVWMLDTTSGAATELIRNAPYAHGITYDPYSGDFILAGNNEIAEVSTSGTLVSVWRAPDLTGSFPSVFDQVSVDGEGHLFAAANNGNLYFIDYSAHPQDLADGTNYIQHQFLTNNLDDIVNALPEVPFAGLLPLLLVPAIAILRRRSRRPRLA